MRRREGPEDSFDAPQGSPGLNSFVFDCIRPVGAGNSQHFRNSFFTFLPRGVIKGRARNGRWGRVGLMGVASAIKREGRSGE
ncbi:MAG: hypothetical protein D6679_02335 [Candidatus Hydrogenedentota bacterium]|nr:MAG: hypothetical protein D6679_02335 [Candidatus Hydrogenedentota bacterium]